MQASIHQLSKGQVKSSSDFHLIPDHIIIMKVYTSVVLLLLGSVFAIAATGPISKASIKDIISDVLSQEVQNNAGMHIYE